MQNTTSAEAVLDRHFLEMRCRLIDLAAAFDRIDRAGDAARAGRDERIHQLEEAARILVDGRGDRAVRILMAFSDPYDDDWPRPKQNR